MYVSETLKILKLRKGSDLCIYIKIYNIIGYNTRGLGGGESKMSRLNWRITRALILEHTHVRQMTWLSKPRGIQPQWPPIMTKIL